MKIKVCGMRKPENIEQLAKLPIDFMGFIFYPQSPRYVGDMNVKILDILPERIKRIGVFVNENPDSLIEKVNRYKLDLVQLHGAESSDYCKQIQSHNVQILKAFNVSDGSDFEKTEDYEEVCNYFLFDTKTSQHGGSGQKFDWTILNQYTSNKPFFLSGGISINDIASVKEIRHDQLFGLDLNSKFETEPGLKDTELVDKFLKEIQL